MRRKMNNAALTLAFTARALWSACTRCACADDQHAMNNTRLRTPLFVLVASGLLLSIAMGIRRGFGLFLQPMSADLAWSRESFALRRQDPRDSF